MSKKKDTLKVAPVPDAVRLGENSTIGLNILDGRIYDEPLAEFRWPELVHTCRMMSNDETVYAAENAIKSIIRRLAWKVNTREVPEDDPNIDVIRDREKFISECMGDMESSWADFINEAMSFLTYGHALHEKVYKVRKGLSGRYPSKFNDNKLGWAKLPTRAQDTIFRWNYDDRFQRILSVEQDLSSVQSYVSRGSTAFTGNTSRKEIRYDKLLHFKHDSLRGNPEGRTPLRACYKAFKYKTAIAEFEAIGVSRDMNGMPVIGLPPEYMSEDADEGKKAVYEYMKNLIRNIHMNEQAGVVFPRFIDAETRNDMFDFKLISVDGNKQFDTDKIINRYENKILMAYLADVLKMGQESQGSFALSDNKTNLLAVGIESILKEILDVINRDLIVQTAVMNGWDLEIPLPEIGYDDIDERDLEKLGGFIQKTVSVGAVEVDQNLSDGLREIAKLPKADVDAPIRRELMTPVQSSAAEGMVTDGDGTRTSPGGGNASTGNASRNTS